MLKKFISYYKPHMKLFTLDMACAFMAAICDLIFPTITGNIIDQYIPNKQIRLLIVWSVTLLLIFIVKAILKYVVAYYGHVVGVRMQGDMRRDVFKHMQTLPFSYFDSTKTGTIMSRIINDLMQVSELAHHGAEDMFISTIMLVGTFLILCSISLPLTLIIFFTIPFLIIFASKMRKKMNTAFTKTREEIANVNANLENSISGIRVAKAFTNAEYEEQKFEHGNNAFKKAREFAYRTMGEFHSGMGFLTDFLNLVVMAGGGIFCYYGKITFGDFVKYLLYINMFLVPIRSIIGFIESYQDGMTGFKRFLEILNLNPEPETPNAKEIYDIKGDIEFKDVSFTYGDGKEVLSHININVPHGKTIAFVGPSGGGKTTICHLIPRFYDITEGEICIDGHNIKDFTYQSLREQIGIVQQDVFLFTGTILDNIAYGKVDATDDEIMEAAKNANIHEFIMELPDQYQTFIGERGVKLSGGQKQRISIARIFLKNPPILILDEATSALDNVTELQIQEALDKLSRDKTTLIVAHRLSTIKNADCITVVTNEGIAETGTHEELLEKGGIYQTLYNSQFKLNNG